MVISERQSHRMHCSFPIPFRHVGTSDSLPRSTYRGHTLKQTILRQEQLATYNSFASWGMDEDVFTMLASDGHLMTSHDPCHNKMHKATRLTVGGVRGK